MKERLKLVRKKMGLTQEEFADRLGIKRGAISNYEIGRNVPIDAVLSLICHEFGVNNEWLRTGNGDMFAPKTDNALEELVRIRGLSVGDRLLIEKFLNLKASERQVVLKYVLSVAADYCVPDMEMEASAEMTTAPPAAAGQEPDTPPGDLEGMTTEQLEALYEEQQYKKRASGSA